MKEQTIIDFIALIVFLIIFFGFHFLFRKIYREGIKEAKEGLKKLNEADRKRWEQYESKKSKSK